MSRAKSAQLERKSPYTHGYGTDPALNRGIYIICGCQKKRPDQRRRQSPHTPKLDEVIF
ncbi:hypothetical protein M404DRAFT_843620 [Pisolithus tinctorius Marx 270]|uniref:Uncharacterized protein n=1 Tax=Pisolithus tinctorius Marx 270 TaxID=870435 RepID=A0A0C3PS16_PISTI|nr:hypothetical protein M404DRAFT_843620 [Pisolithus tinctorius Marx 270]